MKRDYTSEFSLEKKHDPLRKIGVGAASIMLSASVLMLNTKQVRADDISSNANKQSSSQVDVDGSTASNADLIDTSTSVNVSGTTKTTTTVGTLNPEKNLSKDSSKEASLSSSVENAKKQGLTVTQTETKTYGNVKDAGKDYADQIRDIDRSVSKYQQALAEYNKSVKEYDATVHEYQVAKEEYEKALAQYQKEQKAYQDYQDRVAKDLSDLNSDTRLSSVTQNHSSDQNTETTTISANVKLPQDLQDAINQAKELGINVEENAPNTAETVEEALRNYAAMKDKINEAISAYSVAMEQYNAKRAVYQEQKAKYDQEKQAYDEYQKQLALGQGAGAAVAAQGLVFERQTQATMTITGADTYMTKEVSDQLNNQDVISRFDKAKLDALTDEAGNRTAYQNTNPNNTSENTWLIFKKKQPVTVTYHDLSGVTYDGKNVDHVVYVYTLESSSDGSDEAMAQIMHDPTETIWVGSNSKDPNQHLRVKMDIAFYDEDGNKIDTSNGRAVLSLSSLNHYTGIPYVTDDGQQDTIPMNHLERVNIGNNEFVSIPGSSVTLNEDGWVYSKNSNQRSSEGAQFDADDMYAYVNNDTSEVYLTTDSDISNNSYIKAHGGAEKWTRGVKNTGWDSLPSATENGKWPVNKYYGAGAMKLIDGSIYFDVSGNNPDFNTSYWFVINSAVAVPQDPGEEPKEPVKPTQTVVYNQFMISKSESVAKPTTPEPKFDHDEPGDKPTAPDVPEVKWHLAKVIEIKQENIPDNPGEPEKPNEPTVPSVPDNPTPKEPQNPDTPDDSNEPDTLSDSEDIENTKKNGSKGKIDRLKQQHESGKIVTETEIIYKNNQNKLPQTGDDRESERILTIIGATIFTFLSSLTAIFIKHRDF